MKTIYTLLIATFLLYMPFHASAWGANGHRIVGEIGESYLTAKAKLAIQQILGFESLAIASTYSDFIKSDTSYKYLDAWHYCDFEDGFTKETMNDYFKNDTAVDAYTKLNFIIKELKNKSITKEKKQFYLRMLIHIVGDVHQPFHVGRQSDLGANRVRLSWFNEPTNLHAVWDEKLIENQKLSYTEYTKAINHTTLAERKKLQQQPMSDWFYESYVLSRKVYTDTKPDAKLSYRYTYDHIAEVNAQLVKAGVRLAGVLNSIYDK